MNPRPAEPEDAVSPARRGRPRSEAVEQAIIEGALRLLEEGTSIDALSVERVARVAGVGKATVYRRWPGGKDEMLLAVVKALEEPPAEPSGESVRDDLVTLLEWHRRVGMAKRQSAVLRTMTSHVKSHPELWRQYHDNVIKARREMLHCVLRRGVAGGELRGDLDVELLGELFTGPMLVRTVLHEDKDLPPGLPEQIVDSVLDGVRARG
ncbi:TetR/AcrR family transcriptional regulator [Streptomyces sp. HNM0575]|uniref:TetR/AcrR family transcriptional regulator n=1 Tax=Streptomyces sp. HNM0575 TaxID=2716338 RepID=UPI00145EF560|nr:TetR/AcrR family transcriptional regulator [Streptomyces sp. HNM0575]NLU71770.1 TetR/AcrR family transcriptional regulator [Streptomyces sp. HNM0575]